MKRVRSLIAWTCTTVAVLWLLGPNLAGQHRAALSQDLAEHLARHSSHGVRVIVHGDPATVARLAARHGVHVARFLQHDGVLEANSVELEALSQDSEIDHLSGDLPVMGGMTISNQATGADQVWKGFSGFPGMTGAGIGVAVVDSGIKTHDALSKNIKTNVTWVSGGATDAYGHGTHVAGIIAGDGAAATKVTSLYNGGIASGASLINLKVLGADGSGLTSDVIAAIDWAVTNRAKYNIRVINLSLGHLVMEPSSTDPLCAAVARAYDAGIVVVASAGNLGKTSTGTPVLGGIVSPGNSPYAITVGALNTSGTGGRIDDIVTTYSSRGPTRYDLRIKPDVVAPGNKIVSLEADGSYLAKTYPSQYVAGGATNAYFQMSGSSMATAMVSGAVALLLEANPALNPRQVKMALQMGASFMSDAGLVGGGAGSINLLASRQIASQGPTDPIPGGKIAGVLVTPGGVAYWDPGTMTGRLYGGTGLLSLAGSTAGSLWANTDDRIIWGDLYLLGMSNPISGLGANRTIWGDVSLWANTDDRIIWGDTIVIPNSDRIIWGDSLQSLTTANSDDRIIWGDAADVRPDP